MWLAASKGCSFWWSVIVVAPSLSHLPKEVQEDEKDAITMMKQIDTPSLFSLVSDMVADNRSHGTVSAYTIW